MKNILNKRIGKFGGYVLPSGILLPSGRFINKFIANLIPRYRKLMQSKYKYEI